MAGTFQITQPRPRLQESQGSAVRSPVLIVPVWLSRIKRARDSHEGGTETELTEKLRLPLPPPCALFLMPCLFKELVFFSFIHSLFAFILFSFMA